MFKFARIAAAALLLYLSPAVAFAGNLLVLPITYAGGTNLAGLRLAP
jgi:hypothetical protein